MSEPARRHVRDQAARHGSFSRFHSRSPPLRGPPIPIEPVGQSRHAAFPADPVLARDGIDRQSPAPPPAARSRASPGVARASRSAQGTEPLGMDQRRAFRQRHLLPACGRIDLGQARNPRPARPRDRLIDPGDLPRCADLVLGPACPCPAAGRSGRWPPAAAVISAYRAEILAFAFPPNMPRSSAARSLTWRSRSAIGFGQLRQARAPARRRDCGPAPPGLARLAAPRSRAPACRSRCARAPRASGLRMSRAWRKHRQMRPPQLGLVRPVSLAGCRIGSPLPIEIAGHVEHVLAIPIVADAIRPQDDDAALAPGAPRHRLHLLASAAALRSSRTCGSAVHAPIMVVAPPGESCGVERPPNCTILMINGWVAGAS